MRVVHSEKHRLHDPEHDVEAGVAVPQREVPARVQRILEALRQDGSFTIGPPREYGPEPVEAVHAPGLIAFLREAWPTWRATSPRPEMFPDSFQLPGLRAGMDTDAPQPQTPLGRAGYWCFDTGTPIVPGTHDAARAAVDVALTAVDLVLSGERVAYGLCRPPGHHAASAVYGGFCYFNNAAIVAEHVVRATRDKVAVLDLDYHHGNGTQQIFYRRCDVLCVSLHGDPARAYPYFTGHADETGAGAGAGTNLNIPLPAGTDNDRFLVALDQALETVTRFAPAMTIVSLGIDTYAQDPLGDFNLTTPVYEECGRRVAAAVDRLVILQEGGYYLPHLGENVRTWLSGALSAIGGR